MLSEDKISIKKRETPLKGVDENTKIFIIFYLINKLFNGKK